MKSIKTLILPAVATAIVGACAPYPPHPYPPSPHVPAPDTPPALTDEEQRQLEENRQRLERERREREAAANNVHSSTNPGTKPKYPTAVPVPGQPGLVYNPYTHNKVDVKGIASGKLVRDPEDSDPTHKFRVP